MTRISSYDENAYLPKLGSMWVWEIEKPNARALIEVVEVKWNGEEWWVATRTLLGRGAFTSWPDLPSLDWNDLTRFWESTQPVGAIQRERRHVARGIESRFRKNVEQFA